jgi:hypothetical protein
LASLRALITLAPSISHERNEEETRVIVQSSSLACSSAPEEKDQARAFHVRKRFGDGGDDAALDLLSAVTWNPDAPGRRAFFSLAQPFTAGMVSRRDMSPIHRASSPLELKHPPEAR